MEARRIVLPDFIVSTILLNKTAIVITAQNKFKLRHFKHADAFLVLERLYSTLDGTLILEKKLSMVICIS